VRLFDFPGLLQKSDPSDRLTRFRLMLVARRDDSPDLRYIFAAIGGHPSFQA
jgi:hypothetical protein